MLIDSSRERTATFNIARSHRRNKRIRVKYIATSNCLHTFSYDIVLDDLRAQTILLNVYNFPFTYRIIRLS